MTLRVALVTHDYQLGGGVSAMTNFLYRVLRETFPKTYSARLRLRPAPLVKLHLENEYPRASVTTRLGKIEYVDPDRVTDREETGENVRVSKIQSGNLYYGPFPSRAAAEKFASDALDFLLSRRATMFLAWRHRDR